MQPLPPFPRAALLSSLQQGITELLTTYEPLFIEFGFRLFVSFATILIAWHGLRMMFTLERGFGDQIFKFAQLLLFIAFGYAMIAWYESPLPGIGVSFSNLITDQVHYFAHILDARSLQQTWVHLNTLARRLLQPDPWAILANLLYWILLVLVLTAKGLSLAIVTFSLVATAVCGLLGPLFVPFFIVPKLDWLFWSWLKSTIQYAFVEVVTYAYLMIFERFIFAFIETLPMAIAENQFELYGFQIFMVVLAFCVGLFLIPSLTSSLFSGRGGESILPDRIIKW